MGESTGDSTDTKAYRWPHDGASIETATPRSEPHGAAMLHQLTSTTSHFGESSVRLGSGSLTRTTRIESIKMRSSCPAYH